MKEHQNALLRSTVDLLAITPVANISDEEIWDCIVTPYVKGLLGAIRSRTIGVRETVAGDFEGDHVTNLNDHRLYGGKREFVRFPYVNCHYKTDHGALVIKRDFMKLKVMGWWGDPETGSAELIFNVALRDRRFDGTKRASDSSLVDFRYDDPHYNRPLLLDDMPEDATSVELSIYGYMPGSRITDATGDKQYEAFIRNPFAFVNRPVLFKRLLTRAWETMRAPGQIGRPIPDVALLVPSAAEATAIAHGYDYIEGASSHYHVARWSESRGYRYTDSAQGKLLADITDGIKRIKESGRKLTRSQESWLCVGQSLPREAIPDDLFLNGLVWPQDNIGPCNLWMYKPLSVRARGVSES